GVYDSEEYPFLLDELELLRACLQQRLPTVGICLGAQLLASALGARVYPGPHKEIGWSPLSLTEAGAAGPLVALGAGLPVLHWHGDSFDLPAGATLLASTALYRHQAFALGPTILGLQFHPEVLDAGTEA